MCDLLPGYSCDQAPIGSNVVPAWDEHFRRDQTYIPNRYTTACESEGCFETEKPESGCGTEVCGKDLTENFDGHHRGGRRWWRRRYGYRHGFPYYPYVVRPTTIVREVPAPKSPFEKLTPWLLPAGAFLAVLYLGRKK